MTGGMRQIAPLPREDLDKIVDRLHNTQTKSSSAQACKASSARIRNQVARQPLPEEERLEIYKRLYSTHTKASAGGMRCKSADPLQTPGMGLKMLPVIEGLEKRFRGRPMKKEEAEGVVAQRLYRAKTASTNARLAYPRILLYPERTLVGGDVERVRAYHESGTLTKQSLLGRREKWYL